MEKIKKHLIPFLLIFLSSISLMFISYISPYYVGDDTVIHMVNIEEVKSSITKDDLLPNVINKNVANNFGYGTNLFYPPLAYLTFGYMAKLLSSFNIGTLTTVKLVYNLTLFLSGISMYLLSYSLTKKRHLAFLSAIIYMSFPYHISEIYIRDALAEAFIFPFLPLIFLGIYNLFEGNKKRFYPLFIIGYVGGILSHFTLMIYFTVLLSIFLLIYYKKVFKKDFLIPFTTATLTVLLITGFFLESMLTNKIFGSYAVFQEGVMAQEIGHYAINLWDYVLYYPTNEINHAYPYLVTILLLLTIINYKKLKFPKYSKGLIIFGIIALIMTTKLFFWDSLPNSFRILQFPFRIEVFVGIIVSLYAPIILTDKSIKLVFLSSSVILLNVILFTRFNSNIIYNLDERNYNDGMGWQQEYLPQKTKENILYFNNRSDKIIVLENNANIKIINNDVPNLDFIVDTNTLVEVELPRLYYFGYVLKDENNSEYHLEESDYGFIKTVLDNGVYHLSYEGTRLNNFLKKLSVITIFVSIIIYFLYFYKSFTFNKKESIIKKRNGGNYG